MQGSQPLSDVLEHSAKFRPAHGARLQERQQRETLQQRADKLAAKLRELGIDPEQL